MVFSAIVRQAQMRDWRRCGPVVNLITMKYTEDASNLASNCCANELGAPVRLAVAVASTSGTSRQLLSNGRLHLRAPLFVSWRTIGNDSSGHWPVVSCPFVCTTSVVHTSDDCADSGAVTWLE